MLHSPPRKFSERNFSLAGAVGGKALTSSSPTIDGQSLSENEIIENDGWLLGADTVADVSFCFLMFCSAPCWLPPFRCSCDGWLLLLLLHESSLPPPLVAVLVVPVADKEQEPIQPGLFAR